MNARVQPYIRQHCILLADFAVNALVAEVNLTPKPALVDQRGSGAHDDLTLDLMERSAHSLHPMFVAMAHAAFQHATCSQALREAIGEIGRVGEATMLDTTNGVNTHRGAIWALGLMVTASALMSLDAKPVQAVELCQLAGKIAQFGDRFIPQQALSHGQQVQKVFGRNGAKAQAQQGFPTIVKFGLPELDKSRQTQGNETTARVDALLAMMTTLDDTCVLYRAGETGLARMQQGAQDVLDLGGYSTFAGQQAFNSLEQDLLRLRASPGGVADLLAATLFIDRVEQFYFNNK
ncbi:triphosphoribosyl-dephospho-CoA synthase [Acinetobacter bohemicus]|uniref:triphosphoribosyl-dephospho-CoA synthase n=1 Tax=Acinetobacter bohemicus TaxID=1435036 RepID=UPI0040412D84